MPFKLLSHGASDVGLVRTNNEDSWLASQEKQLFLLADGLGGHQAGEVAAREAVDQFFSLFCHLPREGFSSPPTEAEIIQFLTTCFERTNQYLFSLSCSHELLHGMGTTFCALAFYEDRVAICHVGDSRIYRLRNAVLEQMTHDHCWTRRMLLGAGQAEWSGKGMLTRALGTGPAVEPTIHVVQVLPNDLFLLCSDGLSDMVEFSQVESVLNSPMTIGERVRMLIACAKQNGGGDNITIILVEAVNGQNIP